MKRLLLILFCLPMIGFGQSFIVKTYVPDDNFENYLEVNGMGDGVQLNDSINFCAIEMLIHLDVSNQNISNLTGIEDFTALLELNCSKNQLSEFDVSHNTYLSTLDCSDNYLTILNLSQNTALTLLRCYNNQLLM